MELEYNAKSNSKRILLHFIRIELTYRLTHVVINIVMSILWNSPAIVAVGLGALDGVT